MNVKSPTTCKQQIKILQKRGLVIEDEEHALAVLDTVNYYVLSGYLFGFKNNDGKYLEGLTFERIYSLYKFDNVLRNILMFAIERIEHALKARVSMIIAMAYPQDPCIYESSDLFKNRLEHVKFMESFVSGVRRNSKVPFVKHHIENYDSHFPIWVAVELFILGNIKHLYQNLPSRLRKDISSTFNVAPRVLDSWIENLRVTRNSLAHNMRIYGTRYMKTPKMPKEMYRVEAARHRIFDQIFMMGFLYPEKSEWHTLVDDIEELIDTYAPNIDLREIGFPDGWQKILHTN